MTEVADRPGRALGHPCGSHARPRRRVPAVDVAALGEHLLGRWADVRREARDLAARPELHKQRGSRTRNTAGAPSGS